MQIHSKSMKVPHQEVSVSLYHICTRFNNTKKKFVIPLSDVLFPQGAHLFVPTSSQWFSGHLQSSIVADPEHHNVSQGRHGWGQTSSQPEAFSLFICAFHTGRSECQALQIHSINRAHTFSHTLNEHTRGHTKVWSTQSWAGCAWAWRGRRLVKVCPTCACITWSGSCKCFHMHQVR